MHGHLNIKIFPFVCHEGVGGMEIMLHTFLTLALVCLMPWLLCPHGNSPITHCVGDWVSPRAGVDILEKRKKPSVHSRVTASINVINM